MKSLLVLILLMTSSTRTFADITTQGSTVQTTTVNPCFISYGCLNGASCPNEECVCMIGFQGQTCGQSALSNLVNQVSGTSDLATATKIVEDAHAMMDNQLIYSFNGMKNSIESTNTIAEEIVKTISKVDELTNNAVVDLSTLTQGITEMTTDVLEGTRQAKDVMTPKELETAVLSAESNLLSMMNIMADKRDSSTGTSTEIETAEVSARVIKSKGGDLPSEYVASNGGFSLPFVQTFQDKNRKQNVSINVITYKESPYLHVTNPDDVGTSVIKLNVLDKKGHQLTDIKDKDDPIDVFINTNRISGDEFFNDMTESFADSGVYMSYVNTNQTAGGFMLEIKLASMKICDTYIKYYSFPDADSFDMHVQTKGKSKIIDRHPLDLTLSFGEQILKVSLAPDGKKGTLKPVVVTTSCEDDRHDARRRKRAIGLSKVKHQFRTVLLSVKTLKDKANIWTASSDITGIGAGDGRVQFKSQFFGTFSANMFFIGPSPIDFSKLFATFTTSLADSPYALSAIVGVMILFALLTVPLCRFDKNDNIMWSFLPLVDNPIVADIVYYIAVETSVTSSKVMTSTVFINLIGKTKSSGTRKLDDGIRQNFKRGTSSHFEMRLAKDLGDLKTLQIWHDNKDGRTAWNLRKVSIIKAETNERYTFLCGKWLSLDSEDGRTWRSMGVFDASVIETDALFFNLSQRKIFDDHLWVSLFKRPTFSRFTRVQRLWCLAALLFLAMISSAMWYDTPNKDAMQTISVGPIALSYKQFYVGFLSAMIAIVPSMVLVMIFKNRKFKGEQYSGCCVPWWFIFIAYLLIFLCIGTSAFFVFLYSLQWGGTKSLEWMVSFVLSIFQSVIFLEPVKAIILAILIACLFKKIGSKELSDKSIPVPTVVKYTEIEYLKKLEDGKTTLNDYPEFPGIEKETAETVVAIQRAQIDKRLWSKFQSWLGIILYVVLVAVICSHSKVSTAYRQNDHILNTLTTVNEPKTIQAIYDYLKTTFILAVYPKWWASEDDELLRSAYEQRFIYNAYNFRLTQTRLRQVRVMGNCTGPSETRDTVDRCIPTFNEDTEEKRPFCKSWQDFNETGCFDENEEYQYSFLYSTASQSSRTLTYMGKHGTYGPGGYYVDLGPIQSLVIKYLDLLQGDNWIDYRTRAVFLDVVTYNANTRLFSHIKVVFEIPTTGSVTMTTEVWSANLYPYVYPLDYVVLLLQIIFIIVWCVRFVLFIIMLCKQCKKSLRSVSTYLRLLELTFGATAIVCCILRIDATIAAISDLRKSIGKYASFELVRVYDAAYQGCLAAVLFIITLDLLKPLEFNYHFFMLISSLKIAKGAIAAFMLIIAIELIAFSSLLYLTIGRRLEQFRSMPESMNTILTVLLSMMSYSSEEFDDLLLKFYFGLFTLTVSITLVNVFIALLTFAFNGVKEGLENGSLQFDQKLHDHFWFKVAKVIEWIREKFCLSFTGRNRNELEQLQESIERLKRITKNISTNDLECQKMAAELMIKMIQQDKQKTELDCLDIQWTELSTKYLFGFSETGETLVILTVPILSCDVEIELSCYLVPCLRRHCIRKTKNKNVGRTFMFVTNDNHLLKGSIVLEVLEKQYNSMVAKTAMGSPWEQHCAFTTTTGVRAAFLQIPMHFAAMRVNMERSGSEWRPFETYKIPLEGGTAFPSYDPDARISFSEHAFDKECTVSLRTKPGEVASVLNVVLDFPPNLPLSVHLPQICSEVKSDNLAELMIAVRDGANAEWEKLNSVITKEEDGFLFSFNNSKACSNFEVTVKNSTILWVSEFGIKTHYDVDLIKAIIMVSNNRDVANKWRKLAELLNIAEEEIETLNDSPLCKEEKCFMVFRKWLERSEVSFKHLTNLLTMMDFRIIAEHIRKKWIINHPRRQLSKSKSTFFTKTPGENISKHEPSTPSMLSLRSIE